MDRRLAELARTHAVALLSGTSFRGSGFLVDPATVLTCAHVIAGIEGTPRVRWYDGQEIEADVQRMLPDQPGDGDFHRFPDLARLKLRHARLGLVTRVCYPHPTGQHAWPGRSWPPAVG